MNGVTALDPDESEFVEVDPTGRYGRYDEILGKGASKTVYKSFIFLPLSNFWKFPAFAAFCESILNGYFSFLAISLTGLSFVFCSYKAFDEYEGIEVAWNQVKLYDFLQSPEDLERLYCEIHLLKTLKHRSIMKFYTSWVDIENRNINFVTELFTSGTLRQYRRKHRRVNIRAVKHWCRQILEGLLYLHSHDPPIIHRDLKCDNIFVNGNQGEVKIGDLGLAAILRKSHAARCVGTPEFMAPEVYAEEYNELVDIYAFGMCILEMVTFEYPYSECSHPAQIYKKVVSGKKPDALYKVRDPEVRQFVEKCLATLSSRLPARELLKDPFLQIEDYSSALIPLDHCRDFDGISSMLRQPLLQFHSSGYSNYLGYEPGIELDYNPPDFESDEYDLLTNQEDKNFENVDITIKGRREDDGIFLRLRMADKEGRIRNIYFPFDIETDTALSVATEMVAELDITDQDVTKIADMIDGEIVSLVPEWKKGLDLDESTDKKICGYCQNCASSGRYKKYNSPNNQCSKNLQVLHCSRHGCAATHGRFEEITYQFDGSEQCATEGAPVVSSQSDGMHYSDVWAHHDEAELSSRGSGVNPSDDEHEQIEEPILGKDERIINMDKESESRKFAEVYENEIRQELRWLKAKYQMQLRELRDQQLGAISRNSSLSPNAGGKEQKKEDLPLISSPTITEEAKNENLLKSFASGKHFSWYIPSSDAEKRNLNQRVQENDVAYGACSPEHMVIAKSCYTGGLLPHSLNRATSLPVDAVDF